MTEGPENPKVARKLAAILAADIAGYSALMGADEARTVRDLKSHQAVVLPMIVEHGGRTIDTAGDGILAEFASVVNAIECAVAIQKTMAGRNTNVPADRRVQFRIGVNLGDVIHDDSRVYGDGVNIAARLESIAEPGGICLSAEAYAQVHRKLSLNATDLGDQQLKNIAQPVRVYRIRAGEAQLTGQRPALTIPDKPSIAVLPFTNLSGDPKEDYFSDGITEDIITELSRFSELFVIARNSSFQYKGKSPDIRQVGRELGVRYVLEGSIRRAGDRVRITGQLIDATTGAHRWAERYDRKLEDVFAVQDEVARTIVTILAAQVNKAEAERTLLKPPTTWHAYDYYIRAVQLLNSYSKSFKVDDLYEARRGLEQSLVADPMYARALARLSWTHYTAWAQPLDQDYLAASAFDRALKLATNAVQLDPNLPEAYADLGYIIVRNRKYEEAIATFEKAFALNPNYTDWRFIGVLVIAGDSARALDVGNTHIRLDPYYMSFAALWVGAALYMLRRYSEALPWLRESVSRGRNQYSPVWLAATYAQLGRTDEAKTIAAEVLRRNPKYTFIGTHGRVNPFKSKEDNDHLLDGALRAGLPQN